MKTRLASSSTSIAHMRVSCSIHPHYLCHVRIKQYKNTLNPLKFPQKVMCTWNWLCLLATHTHAMLSERVDERCRMLSRNKKTCLDRLIKLNRVNKAKRENKNVNKWICKKRRGGLCWSASEPAVNLLRKILPTRLIN
jgi:hypothetical protein